MIESLDLLGEIRSHKHLMQQSEQIDFRIVEAFDTLSEARTKEYELIKYYRKKGYKLFNTEYEINNLKHKNMYTTKRRRGLKEKVL